MKERGISLILLMTLILTMIQAGSTSATPTVRQPVVSIKGINAFIVRNPIRILNDSAFTLYGFNGSGIINDPYLIERYNITSSSEPLIYIENTTKYFRIANCYLSCLGTTQDGINLDNVTHGTIYNNTICEVGFGIVLHESNNNTILENTVVNNSFNGIDLTSSNFTTILENTVVNNSINGIDLTSSNFATILENTVYNNSNHGILVFWYSSNNNISNNLVCNCSNMGIFLAQNSNNNTLSDNLVYNCSNRGIYLSDSSKNNKIMSNTIYNCYYAGINTDTFSAHNTISNNLIYYCNLYGINLVYSNNNTLTHNTIYNCSYGSICLHQSSTNKISYNIIFNNTNFGLYTNNLSGDNTAKWNNFITNCYNSGYTQAYDNGTNNNISNNYWFDHVGSGPYYFNGSANNNDSFPLNDPVPPILTILAPIPQKYEIDTISILFSGNAFQYTYYIEGIDTQNHSWITQIDRTLNDGNYIFHGYGTILTTTVRYSVLFTIDTSSLTEHVPIDRNISINQIQDQRPGLETELFLLLLGSAFVLLMIIIPLLLIMDRKTDSNPKKHISLKRNLNVVSESKNSVSNYSVVQNGFREQRSEISGDTTKNQRVSNSLYKFPNEELSKKKPIKPPFYVSMIIPIIWFIFHILKPPQARKLSTQKTLDNPFRKRILAILKEKEIEYYIEIQSKLKCGVSVLLWHLQVLEDFGLIKHRKMGRNNVYFLSTSKIDEFKIRLFSLIRHPTTLLIANSIFRTQDGKCTKKSLIEKTALSNKTISYHCNKLIELGLLTYSKNSKSFSLVNTQKHNLEWLLRRNNII